MSGAARPAMWLALLLCALAGAAQAAVPPPGQLIVNARTNAGMVPRRLFGFNRTHYYQIPGAPEGA